MYTFIRLLVVFTAISVQGAYSQSRSGDSLSYHRALERSLKYSSDTLVANFKLYNGIEHPGYFRGIKGIPYLDSDVMTEGSVKYDEVWYTVPMMYDLYAEKLVLTHFNQFFKMSLINEKIGEFILHDHLFRNLPAGTSEKNALSGLCEVLYDGDSISLFAKKRKLLNERSTSQGLEREFIVNNQYYLRINGEYHQVRSKGDMFRLMGDKRKDVVSQLRRRKVKFRKNKEEALIIASRIYDDKI